MQNPQLALNSKKQSLQKCSLETGGATQHDPNNQIDDMSADQQKPSLVMMEAVPGPPGNGAKSKEKQKAVVDEVDGLNQLFKQQLD